MNQKFTNLTFIIQKECIYGYVVYISGETEEFGEWDINRAIQMKWENGHYWTAELPLLIYPADRRVIQYKYVIAEEYQPKNCTWEKNVRQLHCEPLINKKKYLLEEFQDQRLFKLRLPFNFEDIMEGTAYDMRVLGDIPQLGNVSKIPLKMDIVELTFGYYKKKYWEFAFWQPVTTEYFVYNYIMYFKDGKMRLTQRGYENICILNQACFDVHNDINKESEFKLIQNIYKKRDLPFNKEFEPLIISKEIVIGPYPVLQSDFKKQEELEIKTAICLLTEDEFKLKNMDLKFYKKLFKRNGIKFAMLPLSLLWSQNIISSSINKAKRFISKNVNKSKNVYIFSNCGMDRPPKLVASYYYEYKNSELSSVLHNMKSKMGNNFDEDHVILTIGVENDFIENNNAYLYETSSSNDNTEKDENKVIVNHSFTEKNFLDDSNDLEDITNSTGCRRRNKSFMKILKGAKTPPHTRHSHFLHNSREKTFSSKKESPKGKVIEKDIDEESTPSYQFEESIMNNVEKSELESDFPDEEEKMAYMSGLELKRNLIGGKVESYTSFLSPQLISNLCAEGTELGANIFRFDELSKENAEIKRKTNMNDQYQNDFNHYSANQKDTESEG